MDDLVMEIDERLDQDKMVSRDGRESKRLLSAPADWLLSKKN
jgi:hypothetical protein